MVAGLHHVKDHGQADIAIVSDANTFFIEETLKVTRGCAYVHVVFDAHFRATHAFLAALTVQGKHTYSPEFNDLSPDISQ